MQIVRESIFISAIRSFCNSFFAVVGIIVAIIALFAILGGISTKSYQAPLEIDYVIRPDAKGNTKLLPEKDPAILKISITEPIGMPKLRNKTIDNILRASQQGILKNRRVKAILLYINSPGGSAIDSHDIYIALKNYKEKYDIPIYAYVNGLCASGAMMIACAADKIYSNSTSIIGSVGVFIGPFFNFYDFMNNYGVKSKTITRGIDKDALSPFRQWQPGEDKSLQNLTSYYYTQFVDLVASNRPNMDRDKLINEYGAQVYDPVKAKEYGYIDDEALTYNETLTKLVQQAGIHEDATYQVVEVMPHISLINEITMQSSAFFKRIFNPQYLGFENPSQIYYHYDLNAL